MTGVGIMECGGGGPLTIGMEWGGGSGIPLLAARADPDNRLRLQTQQRPETLTVRDRSPHLLLQPPAGPAAPGRCAALRYRLFLPLPSPVPPSLVLKVGVTLRLRARLRHGILVIVHVVVPPLVLAVGVAVLVDDGGVLAGGHGSSLCCLIPEVSGQQEVLQVLVTLLHPPPLGVGHHLARPAARHPLTRPPAVVVMLLGHSGLNRDIENCDLTIHKYQDLYSSFLSIFRVKTLCQDETNKQLLAKYLVQL